MEKIVNWLVLKYIYLSLTFDLIFGYLVLLFEASLGAHTFYKCSTTNLDAKTVCFFTFLSAEFCTNALTKGHKKICFFKHKHTDTNLSVSLAFLTLERWLYLILKLTLSSKVANQKRVNLK